MRTPAPILAYSMVRALASYQQQCHVVRVLAALEHATTPQLHVAVGMSRTSLERCLTRLRHCHVIVAWPRRGATDRQGVIWALAGSRRPPAERVQARGVSRGVSERPAGSWWLGRQREGFTERARARWR